MQINTPSPGKVIDLEEEIRRLYARKAKVDRLIRALERYAGLEPAPRRKNAA